jgi:hypothetical protein
MSTEELDKKHRADENQLQRKSDRAPVLTAGETEQLRPSLGAGFAHGNRSQNYDWW